VGTSRESLGEGRVIKKKGGRGEHKTEVVADCGVLNGKKEKTRGGGGTKFKRYQKERRPKKNLESPKTRNTKQSLTKIRQGSKWQGNLRIP